MLVKSLGRKLRHAVRHAKENNLPTAPDVVAHSFGTHLFTLLLQDPEFKDLQFGRVITVGSVVRPDFNWTAQFDGNRVGAVLNHMGGCDVPVKFAQFMIPGTGPGARIGYLDQQTTNHLDPLFGHSDALLPESLASQLANGGLWDRFLTQPKGKFRPDTNHQPSSWHRSWFGFRMITRLTGWIILIAFGPFSWLRRKIDP